MLRWASIPSGQCEGAKDGKVAKWEGPGASEDTCNRPEAPARARAKVGKCEGLNVRKRESPEARQFCRPLARLIHEMIHHKDMEITW